MLNPQALRFHPFPFFCICSLPAALVTIRNALQANLCLQLLRFTANSLKYTLSPKYPTAGVTLSQSNKQAQVVHVPFQYLGMEASHELRPVLAVISQIPHKNSGEQWSGLGPCYTAQAVRQAQSESDSSELSNLPISSLGQLPNEQTATHR